MNMKTYGRTAILEAKAPSWSGTMTSHCCFGAEEVDILARFDETGEVDTVLKEEEKTRLDRVRIGRCIVVVVRGVWGSILRGEGLGWAEIGTWRLFSHQAMPMLACRLRHAICTPKHLVVSIHNSGRICKPWALL